MIDQVKEIVAQVLNVDQAKLEETTSPDTLMEWTSVKTMNIVIAIEEKFDVQFSDDDIMEMRDLGSIVKILQSNV